MAFLIGGLEFQEQIYDSTVTQMSACLLALSVLSLLIPVRPILPRFWIMPDSPPDRIPRLFQRSGSRGCTSPEAQSRHLRHSFADLCSILALSAQISRLSLRWHAPASH